MSRGSKSITPPPRQVCWPFSRPIWDSGGRAREAIRRTEWPCWVRPSNGRRRDPAQERVKKTRSRQPTKSCSLLIACTEQPRQARPQAIQFGRPMAVVKIDPMRLSGPWSDGYVLERQDTLSSEFLGHDGFGNPQDASGR